ncbi:periplasmic binding protein-like I [Zopfochytrium polystomum]|nr:periplasmic binding protein-like I [Zopfochytrium polystomum]
MFNSFGDRGQLLKGSINAIEQKGVSALIGDVTSDLTVRAVPIFLLLWQQSLRLLMLKRSGQTPLCMPQATSALLSDKLAYPTSYRLTTTGQRQANAIMSLIASKNYTQVAVFSLNDDFGTGMLSSLEGVVADYNITLRVVATGDRLQTVNWDPLFDQVIKRKVQVIIIAAQLNFVVPILKSADRKGMLNGDYWFISTLGWNHITISGEPDLLAKVQGMWKVDQPNMGDYIPTGATKDAQDLIQWWKTLYRPNTGSLSGFPLDFTMDEIITYNSFTPAVYPPSRCKNDSMLSIASEIPPFTVGTVVKDNVTYAKAFVGNQCMGQGMYPESWLAIITKSLGYTPPIPHYEVTQGYRCMKLTVAILDYMLKNGVPLSKIKDRSAFVGINVTTLINNATTEDILGDFMYADDHGDVQSDQTILIYQNTSLGVMQVPIGNWSYRTKTISYFDDRNIFYLGGKLTPPTPPVTPVNQFPAKTALRYAFDAIVVLCSLFSVATVVFMAVHWDLKVFKASSPVFLLLMIVGANISYAGVIYFSIYPMSDSSCIAHVWLKYLGFAAAFGALLVKTFRISVIFGDPSAKKKRGTTPVKLSDGKLGVYFGVFFAAWVALLVVWTSQDQYRPRLVTEVVANVAENGTVVAYDQMPHCVNSSFKWVEWSGWVQKFELTIGRDQSMALTLAYGAFLTNSVKKLPSAFNESKWLAIAIYNWVVIGIVLVKFGAFGSNNAIADFAVQDPDVIFVMDALMAIITQTSVVGLLMVPKILACVRGDGDKTGMSASLGSSHMDNSSNKASVSHLTSGGSHPAGPPPPPPGSPQK